ncbi:hypothetical protein JKP88DRAFT_158854, partial [Tribonema minus]
MKPLVYSVAATTAAGSAPHAHHRSTGWHRSGEQVRYFCSSGSGSGNGGGGGGSSTFAGGSIGGSGGGAAAKRAAAAPRARYTLTFVHTFAHGGDTVYFAHSLPYTYARLRGALAALGRDAARAAVARRTTLCRTLAGNDVPLVTVTAACCGGGGGAQQLARRPAVVLTARVHPGESNASWIMDGLLRFLTGAHPAAAALRERFVFKVIPMLNPDGVINGNHRASLAGCDLNRRWAAPKAHLHPEIYHARALIQRLHAQRGVLLVCDIHAHSR